MKYLFARRLQMGEEKKIYRKKAPTINGTKYSGCTLLYTLLFRLFKIDSIPLRCLVSYTKKAGYGYARVFRLVRRERNYKVFLVEKLNVTRNTVIPSFVRSILFLPTSTQIFVIYIPRHHWITPKECLLVLFWRQHLSTQMTDSDMLRHHIPFYFILSLSTLYQLLSHSFKNVCKYMFVVIIIPQTSNICHCVYCRKYSLSSLMASNNLFIIIHLSITRHNIKDDTIYGSGV